MKLLVALSLMLIAGAWSFGGEQISLKTFAGSYGFPAAVEGQETILYRSKYTEMSFKHDSRMMHYNGVLVWMCAGSYNARGDWKISKEDAEKGLAPLLRSRDFTSKTREPRLVLIDPGHGGSQTGAKPRKGAYEKELTLDVATRIQAKLASAGIKSALTRTKDTDLSLAARPRKIGTLKADLFISIHMNSAGNKAAQGIETYLLPYAGYSSTSGGRGSTKSLIGNRNDELNNLLAYLIQRDAVTLTGANDRGLKRARFDVLANATCPAVLVECGFLSNPGENAKLQSAKYRQKVADGIASGVDSYFKLWKKK